MRPSFLATLTLVSALAACAGPRTQPVDVIPGLDETAFANEVEPLVEVTCATLDCHGRMTQSLRLYSTLGLRASADVRGQSISDAEIVENMRAMVAIDPPAIGAGNALVDQNILLLKAVSLEGGGVHHVGGAIFAPGDHGDTCLHDWLAGTDESNTGWVQLCQAALADATDTAMEAPTLPDGSVPTDDAGVPPVDSGVPPVDMGAGATPTWAADVYPLFASRCVSCHGSRGSGGYSIPTEAAGYAATVGVPARYCTEQRVPAGGGDPLTSGLYLTLIGTSCGRQMPPRTSFTAAQRDLVARWIQGGAPEY